MRTLVISISIMALSVAISHAQQPFVDPVLTLVATDGVENVQVIDDREFEYVRYPGMAIFNNDTIITENNRAEFTFGSGTGRILIGRFSEVDANALTPSINDPVKGLLILNKGAIRASKQTGGGDYIEITTDASLTTFNDADVIIERTVSDSHSVQVYRGSARVVNTLTDEVYTIPAGCQFNLFGLDVTISAILAPNINPEQPCGERNIRGAIRSAPQDRSAPIVATLGDNYTSYIPSIMRYLTIDEPQVVEDSPEPEVEQEIIVEIHEDIEEEVAEPEPVMDINYIFLGLLAESGYYNDELYGMLAARVGVHIEDTFALGLLLPVTFQFDPFDPNTWSRYAGTHEWSFGTESSDAPQDIIRDILTKFGYIRFGNREKTNWEIYIGGLADVGIGRGAIVQNYGNTLDEPIVRRVGADAIFMAPVVEFELFIDDFIEPSLAATRLQFNFPVNSTGIGLYANWDIERLLRAEQRDAINESTLAIAILTLDTSFIFGDPDGTAVEIFSDNALFLPVTFNPLTLDFSSLTRSDGEEWINNYIFSLGVDVNAPVVGFEFGLYSWAGIAMPFVYDAAHERNGRQFANRVYSQATPGVSLSSVEDIFIGPHAELSFDIDSALLTISIRYLAPIQIIPAFEYGTSDLAGIHVDIGNEKTAGFFASLFFERQGVVSTATQSGIYAGSSLFDGYSNYGAAIGYNFDETVVVAIRIGTTTERDDSGAIIFNDNGVANTSLLFAINLFVAPRIYF